MPVRSHPPRVTGAPPSEKVKRKIHYLISFHFLGMNKKRSNMFFKCRVSVLAISFKDKPGNTYEYFIISQRYHHNHSVTYIPIRVFFSSIYVNVTLAIYIHHYQHEELYSKKGKKKGKKTSFADRMQIRVNPRTHLLSYVTLPFFEPSLFPNVSHNKHTRCLHQ